MLGTQIFSVGACHVAANLCHITSTTRLKVCIISFHSSSYSISSLSNNTAMSVPTVAVSGQDALEKNRSGNKADVREAWKYSDTLISGILCKDFLLDASSSYRDEFTCRLGICSPETAPPRWELPIKSVLISLVLLYIGHSLVLLHKKAGCRLALYLDSEGFTLLSKILRGSASSTRWSAASLRTQNFWKAGNFYWFAVTRFQSQNLDKVEWFQDHVQDDQHLSCHSKRLYAPQSRNCVQSFWSIHWMQQKRRSAERIVWSCT